MVSMEFVFSSVIFGIFLVAAFKILFQYSVVRETLLLATDEDISEHLPQYTASHSTFTNKTKRMVINYWVLWYPLCVCAGSTYAWFMTAMMTSTIDHWPLIVIVFLSLAFATTIMKGLFAPFPPSWFTFWSLDLALTENALLIARVENNIQKLINDQTQSQIIKQHMLEQFNLVLQVLHERRNVLNALSDQMKE